MFQREFDPEGDTLMPDDQLCISRQIHAFDQWSGSLIDDETLFSSWFNLKVSLGSPLFLVYLANL